MNKDNPKASVDDRILACQAAMEDEFNALFRRATDAGWDEFDICLALQDFADSRILGISSNGFSDEMMRAVVARKRLLRIGPKRNFGVL